MAAESSSSRALVIRNNAISDLSNTGYNKGEMTVDSAISKGILTRNAVHMVGIATEQETRLDASRYPIRVVIGSAPTRDKRNVVCFGYWRVVGAGCSSVPMSRSTPVTDLMGTNVRKLFPDLDKDWWAYRQDKEGTPQTMAIVPTLAAQNTVIASAVAMVEPTEEVIEAARTAFDQIMASCVVSNNNPYIRIGTDLYIMSVPVGQYYVPITAVPPVTFTAMSEDDAYGYEIALTIKANAIAIQTRYATAKEGTVNLAAHAIAEMFSMGAQETYEHEEFVTVFVTRHATVDSQFTVARVDGPAGYVPHPHIAVGQIIDTVDVRISEELLQLGNLLVFASGLMHYLFNHTTGGVKVTGTLQTILSGRSIIYNGMSNAEMIEVTSIMYEALHPVNKRAVANIMFGKSKVHTHGKSTHSRPYVELAMDTFVQIRKAPYPAGSHKAFTLVTALKRVTQAGYSQFLPWAASIPQVIQMCRDILASGARAHIGAHYYTGNHPVSQSSTLDQYLPEMATFVQIYHKSDSLALSPHLSPEVAARALPAWTNLLKSLKSADLSESSVEKVQKYLSGIGKAATTLNLDDETTWGQAAIESQNYVDAIDRVFD